MDFDFSRLSWRSFEQMVQSLAADWFGSQLMPYGDGPDGGREAQVRSPFTFRDERIDDGRLILQVKFRQRPGDAQTDSAWALDALRRELRTFTPRSGRRPLPEYYVFVTNVALGSGEGAGKDQLAAVLDEARGRDRDLRGWEIWDYDKLRTLLENNHAVRTSYAGWITAGDVLARLAAGLPDPEPAFAQTLKTFLEKELIGDQFVNLEQAGHTSDDGIPLSQVLVDLPTSRNPAGDEDDEDDFLVRAIALAALKLDLESIEYAATQAGPTRDEPASAFEPTQRLVLIGGPGQGKSTLGQYLCQMLRATILMECEPDELSLDGRLALHQVCVGCEEALLDLPPTPRYPLRIVLSDLAEALAAERPPKSLIAFLADKISRRVNTTVSAALLERWMRSHPWLLVLDGLDEVPASSNRDDVLELVTGFWVDIAGRTTDVLVLATSRPQGYNDDFAPETYRHEYLQPLTPERALEYADRLVPVRYRGDVDRQAKVRARLQHALSVPTTGRLMRTPLQVTIMTALVEQMGHPPQERWSLFSEYYNVIYKREMERGTPTAAVLRGHRPDIDAIHRRVALQLQTASETSLSVEARLPRAELRAIVEQRLRQEGHQGDKADALAEQIVAAAEQRLVFLVGAETDQIGFEIRSLQEFMAAEALVHGPEGAVLDRLRAIATSPNWTNVLLFATGHCFVNRQHLREAVHGVCASLNDDPDDVLSSATLTGSELALELLEDGTIQRQPRIASMFTRLALRLLRSADSRLHARLAYQHTETTDAIYREELTTAIAAAGTARLGALHCLALLDRDGVPWAGPLLRASWPTDLAARQGLMALSPRTTWSDDLRPEIIRTLGALGPGGWGDAHGTWHGLGSVDERAAWLDVYYSDASRSGDLFRCDSIVHDLWLTLDRTALLSRGVRPFADTPDLLGTALLGFTFDPSPDALADLLERFADLPCAVWRPGYSHVPWPIGVCLATATDADELRRWARQAREGRLGSQDDWTAAQDRWVRDGVRMADLRADHGDAPLGPDIAEVGFPLICAGTSVPGSATATVFRRLCDVWADLAPGTVRAALTMMLVRLGHDEPRCWGAIPLREAGEALRALPFLSTAPFAMPPTTLAMLDGLFDDDAGAALDVLLASVSVVGALPPALHPSIHERLVALSRRRLSVSAVRILAMSPRVVDAEAIPADPRRADRDRAAVAVLEATRGDARAAGTTFGTCWDGLDALPLSIAALSHDDPERWATFLSAALDGMPPDAWPRRARVTRLLRDLAARRQSPLTDPERWRELELFERVVF